MTIARKYFPVGAHGLFCAPVLLSGERDARLIDGGFTLEDDGKLGAAIQARRKRLTTVYVSQSDPDDYFPYLAQSSRSNGSTELQANSPRSIS